MKANKVVIRRYEENIVNLNNSSEVDRLFFEGVVSGIRTGLFLGTDMSLDEFKELIELQEKGSIKRECAVCFDKTFENNDGQQVTCYHTGYEVHFVGDFVADERNWWNEYEDCDGNLYYGR